MNSVSKDTDRGVDFGMKIIHNQNFSATPLAQKCVEADKLRPKTLFGLAAGMKENNLIGAGKMHLFLIRPSELNIVTYNIVDSHLILYLISDKCTDSLKVYFSFSH